MKIPPHVFFDYINFMDAPRPMSKEAEETFKKLRELAKELAKEFPKVQLLTRKEAVVQVDDSVTMQPFTLIPMTLDPKWAEEVGVVMLKNRTK